ncbi:NADH-quinone oxidoreductase subunit C [Paraburkholderia strydomiana]|uniref:NADH-quinone oxidoreductase subunit C n=1 Tax=Paraburkholderia strydomiana TaxID=1245417 RepID=UPI001BEBC6D1|nr:NADH-quinone oxidoreductase subunit C [Paraburkholderia strydomiana]MBT2794588.1 NADH-quinone oxidoreductase subunit C [Paraburkholderia strydomiana]
MTSRMETLAANLTAGLGDRVFRVTGLPDEVTILVDAVHYREVAMELRGNCSLGFEQLMDLAGVDYSTYGEGAYDGPRFAAVLHLLSISNNWRLRLRVFAPDDDMPILPSVVDVWSSANWYEREAFDLFGIVFADHPDLRRILTDYGFIGNPFRKDFPVTGYVEMRYDPQERRVIYQPVTIEPREITPRIIGEPRYGGLKS